MTATDPRPVVSPSPDAAPFWKALSEHRLVVPRCGACQHAFFYPRVLCPRCGSRDVYWVGASGRGTVYSFCVVHHSSVPGLAEAVPFVTGLVELDEGPRLMAFLRGFPDDPEQIRCGSAVTVEFLDVDDGQAVLAFRPVAEETGGIPAGR
jgi:uncharacterized OB-fold protein